MFATIIESILKSLLEQELLELKAGAGLEELTAELCGSMSQASVGIQFGDWLGKALLGSQLVEELYADDKQLAAMLRDVN